MHSLQRTSPARPTPISSQLIKRARSIKILEEKNVHFQFDYFERKPTVASGCPFCQQCGGGVVFPSVSLLDAHVKKYFIK